MIPTVPADRHSEKVWLGYRGIREEEMIAVPWRIDSVAIDRLSSYTSWYCSIISPAANARTC